MHLTTPAQQTARCTVDRSSSWDAWTAVLQEALEYPIYRLRVSSAAAQSGRLDLALVASRLFGRFLVSLPYINSAGVAADNPHQARELVEQAVQLADDLRVKYLELRHETPVEHERLTHRLDSKVHMRLALPAAPDVLWHQLQPKVRNQVRKAEQHKLTLTWGGRELVPPFYDVFSHNMRDLGTPVFSQRLFASILKHFGDRAELAVVRRRGRAVAGALLVHHQNGMTEIPSASSLRTANWTNANMLMYWQMLRRAIERRQTQFDFGRSTRNSNTYRFKKQWGAEPYAAVWQYYVRHGSPWDMRPESSRNQLLIGIWRRLPVRLTRWIGPPIVRGIP